MISVCFTLLGQAASAFRRRAFDIPLARSMESSLVLRAASCWNAWGEAMNILKIKGLEEETAKRFLEQAYVLGPHILAYPMLTTGESHHRSVVRD